jgi:hypothetical protein
MAAMIDVQKREAMILKLMDRSNLMREDAEAAIAVYLGESPGDVVSVPEPSPDERRRFSPDKTLEAVRNRLLDQTETPVRARG